MIHNYDHWCECTKCHAWRLFTHRTGVAPPSVELPDGSVTNPRLDILLQREIKVYRGIFKDD